MNEKNHETYLGDIICSSGTITKTIDKRCNAGLGAVSESVSMLCRLSLGHNHCLIALIIRDSMIVSKLVSSSETWYHITETQHSKLEEIDEMFFTKIFELPQSVPKLSLYAECGKLPLRFIIQKRRLMYWWEILNRGED